MYLEEEKRGFTWKYLQNMSKSVIIRVEFIKSIRLFDGICG